MKFYKNLFFLNNQPVPVGFERRDNESRRARERRRGQEENELISLKYSTEEVKARTYMQLYASTRNDGSNQLKDEAGRPLPAIEYVEGYDNARREDPIGEEAIALLGQYKSWLKNLTPTLSKPSDVASARFQLEEVNKKLEKYSAASSEPGKRSPRV